MVEIQLPISSHFILEDWLEYSIGVCIIFLRYCIRIRTVGFRGFQGDDYMTVLVRAVSNNYSTLLTNCSKVLALFTMDAVLVDIICK
jgi:hypothetical protein